MIKYGWKFERVYFENGEYGFGIDINTNEEWDNEREFIFKIYIWNFGFQVGKYHYQNY